MFGVELTFSKHLQKIDTDLKSLNMATATLRVQQGLCNDTNIHFRKILKESKLYAKNLEMISILEE